MEERHWSYLARLKLLKEAEMSDTVSELIDQDLASLPYTN